MEGEVILHETIHELHTKKQNGITFKIDFEKDYDKVKLEFLTTNYPSNDKLAASSKSHRSFYTRLYVRTSKGYLGIGS